MLRGDAPGRSGSEEGLARPGCQRSSHSSSGEGGPKGWATFPCYFGAPGEQRVRSRAPGVVMRVEFDLLNLGDCPGGALLMGNQPVDVRRGSVYLFVIRASPRVVGVVWCEFSRVGVAKGLSPSWRGCFRRLAFWCNRY